MALKLKNLPEWYAAAQAARLTCKEFPAAVRVARTALMSAGWSEGVANAEAIFKALERLEPEIRVHLDASAPSIDSMRAAVAAGDLGSVGVPLQEYRRYLEMVGGAGAEAGPIPDAPVNVGRSDISAPDESVADLKKSDVNWILANLKNFGVVRSDAPSPVAFGLLKVAQEDNNGALVVKLFDKAAPKEEARDDTAEDVRAFDAADMRRQVREGFRVFLSSALEQMEGGRTADEICHELIPDLC